MLCITPLRDLDAADRHRPRVRRAQRRASGDRFASEIHPEQSDSHEQDPEIGEAAKKSGAVRTSMNSRMMIRTLTNARQMAPTVTTVLAVGIPRYVAARSIQR